MSKVIDFPNSDKGINEAHYVDYDGDLGVCIEGKGLEVIRLNDNEFLVISQGVETVYTRARLGEFLWLAAHFIDKDQRFMPEDNVVACDY